MFSESENVCTESPPEYIRFYDILVAAGAGSFLDSYAYVDFEVDETVPENADFAVKSQGQRRQHGTTLMVR